MKITNNDGVSGSEHSHLLLDSSLFVENQVCEAISYVTNVKEAETRTEKPYVTFTLMDKHSGVVSASMFGISKKEYSTKLMKSFKNCIVYIKGEVVNVRGELMINLISIDEWTDSVFTKQDFIARIPNHIEEEMKFETILRTIESHHVELKDTVKSIRTLNLVKIMSNSTYKESPGSRIGDLLLVCNRAIESLINTSGTEPLIDDCSAVLLTTLNLGLEHYIRMDSENKSKLLPNNSTQKTVLINNLIKNNKVFGNSSLSDSLSAEFNHLNESMNGIVKPVTMISNTVPKLIESAWVRIHYRRLQDMSITGNEYNYGGVNFVRIL